MMAGNVRYRLGIHDQLPRVLGAPLQCSKTSHIHVVFRVAAMRISQPPRPHEHPYPQSIRGDGKTARPGLTGDNQS